MTQEQFNELYSFFAVLANVERLGSTGEPNTLSLEDVQKLGTKGLDLMDETKTVTA